MSIFSAAKNILTRKKNVKVNNANNGSFTVQNPMVIKRIKEEETRKVGNKNQKRQQLINRLNQGYSVNQSEFNAEQIKYPTNLNKYEQIKTEVYPGSWEKKPVWRKIFKYEEIVKEYPSHENPKEDVGKEILLLQKCKIVSLHPLIAIRLLVQKILYLEDVNRPANSRNLVNTKKPANIKN